MLANTRSRCAARRRLVPGRHRRPDAKCRSESQSSASRFACLRFLGHTSEPPPSDARLAHDPGLRNPHQTARFAVNWEGSVGSEGGALGARNEFRLTPPGGVHRGWGRLYSKRLSSGAASHRPNGRRCKVCDPGQQTCGHMQRGPTAGLTSPEVHRFAASEGFAPKSTDVRTTVKGPSATICSKPPTELGSPARRA